MKIIIQTIIITALITLSGCQNNVTDQKKNDQIDNVTKQITDAEIEFIESLNNKSIYEFFLQTIEQSNTNSIMNIMNSADKYYHIHIENEIIYLEKKKD